MADSAYRNKSGLFEAATANLLSQAQYLPIPHSAYYSCYQLMMHIWQFKLGKTREELTAQISSRGAHASHEYLINHLTSVIQDPGDRNFRRNFRNKIIQLKTMRTRADYQEDTIDREYAEKAIALMSDLLRILKKCA